MLDYGICVPISNYKFASEMKHFQRLEEAVGVGNVVRVKLFYRPSEPAADGKRAIKSRHFAEFFAKSYFIRATFDTFVKREVNDDITSWIIEDYEEFMEL